MPEHGETRIHQQAFIRPAQDETRYKRMLQSLGALEQVFIPYLEMDSVPDLAAVDWQKVSLPGRGGPYFNYGGTAEASTTLTMKFEAHEDAYNDVQRRVMWLQALMHPWLDRVGQQEILRPPPVMELHLGEFFRPDTGRPYEGRMSYRSVYRRGLVTELQVNWTAPVSVINLRPYGAEVTLTFSDTEPRSAQDYLIGANPSPGY